MISRPSILRSRIFPKLTIDDGSRLVTSTVDMPVGVATSASGFSISAAPQALSFSYDGKTGLCRISMSGGRLLTLAGSRVMLAANRGEHAQLWSVNPKGEVV